MTSGRLDPVAPAKKRHDPISHSNTLSVYYLHVTPDNREEKLHYERVGFERLPALRVELLKLADGTLIEQTFTRNFESSSGAFVEFTPVPPRGQGWSMFDASADKYTVWRRSCRVAS